MNRLSIWKAMAVTLGIIILPLIYITLASSYILEILGKGL